MLEIRINSILQFYVDVITYPGYKSEPNLANHFSKKKQSSYSGISWITYEP